MNTQAGDFYLSNEDADRIAASAGLSASEYDALAKAASLEQQQRNQAAVQREIDKKMQILANLNAASRREYKPAHMGMTPVEEQVSVPVPASERLGYATKARELQQEIQRNLSEAGMIQGPSITGPLTPTHPVGSEQPKSEAPAQPPANAPAPEKPQYDPFAEFNNYEKTRKKFFNIAFKYVSQVPIQYQDEALKLVKEEWDNTGPSLPKSTLLPLKHPVTGEILKDQALTADGRIVEIKAPPADKALTESQSKALQFATAMKEADQQVTDLLKRSNYDPTNPLNTLPMFETLKSQDRKLYEGTVRDFAVAILRRTSGAHVSPQEFKITEETYFPQSGDSEAVLKAKERRRKRDVASVYADVPESIRGEIFNQNQQQQSAPGGPPTVFTLVPGQKSLVPAR